MDDVGFEKRVNDHLDAFVRRHRISLTMEVRLLQMLGDRRVKEPDKTMAALQRHGLVCRRLEPVSILFAQPYYILSDYGICQAERFLERRIAHE